MQINILNHFIRPGLYFLTLLCSILIYPEANFGQNAKTGIVPAGNYFDPKISLVYKDTLTLPSITEFSLPVKMKPGSEISAISLGFYFPEEYLEVTGMNLANGTPGSIYSVKDSLFQVVWSDVNPIIINDDDTILTIEMKTLDLTALSGTIKLELYELSEFADESANVIEGVVLEIPEIELFKPEPGDSIDGNYISIYPNPFKDYTTIYFTLKTESQVSVSIFNTSGMELITFEQRTFPEGDSRINIQGLDLAKGVYFLKFEIRNPDTVGAKVIKILSIR